MDLGADLKRRLGATRWPERETVDDWSQGIPLAYLKDVCAYWQEKYDWRARESVVNFHRQLLSFDEIGSVGPDFEFYAEPLSEFEIH